MSNVKTSLADEARSSYAALSHLSLEELASRVEGGQIGELFTSELYAANPLERVMSWIRRTVPALIERSKDAGTQALNALSESGDLGDIDRVAILAAFLAKQSPALAQVPIVELTALAILTLHALAPDRRK